MKATYRPSVPSHLYPRAQRPVTPSGNLPEENFAEWAKVQQDWPEKNDRSCEVVFALSSQPDGGVEWAVVFDDGTSKAVWSYELEFQL